MTNALDETEGSHGDTQKSIDSVKNEARQEEGQLQGNSYATKREWFHEDDDRGRGGLFLYPLLGLLLDSPLVSDLVVLEHGVRLDLGGIGSVRIVQQVLNPQEQLFDSDRRFPSLLLVQDRKTDGPRRVDVGVEERRGEFALWWSLRIVFGERHCHFIQPSFPISPDFPRDTDLPDHQVLRTVRLLLRSSEEAERVIFPPLLAFFSETVSTETGHVVASRVLVWSLGRFRKV